MAAKNPNAEDIYAPSLIDNFIQSGLVNWKMFAFMILLPIINMMGLIKMVNESTEN